MMTAQDKQKKKDAMRTDTDARTPGPARREKDVVTEGSQDSFPASDPPSFMGGSAIAGSPPSKPVKVERPGDAKGKASSEKNDDQDKR